MPPRMNSQSKNITYTAESFDVLPKGFETETVHIIGMVRMQVGKYARIKGEECY